MLEGMGVGEEVTVELTVAVSVRDMRDVGLPVTDANRLGLEKGLALEARLALGEWVCVTLPHTVSVAEELREADPPVTLEDSVEVPLEVKLEVSEEEEETEEVAVELTVTVGDDVEEGELVVDAVPVPEDVDVEVAVLVSLRQPTP